MVESHQALGFVVELSLSEDFYHLGIKLWRARFLWSLGFLESQLLGDQFWEFGLYLGLEFGH